MAVRCVDVALTTDSCACCTAEDECLSYGESAVGPDVSLEGWGM